MVGLWTAMRTQPNDPSPSTLPTSRSLSLILGEAIALRSSSRLAIWRSTSFCIGPSSCSKVRFDRHMSSTSVLATADATAGSDLSSERSPK